MGDTSFYIKIYTSTVLENTIQKENRKISNITNKWYLYRRRIR